MSRVVDRGTTTRTADDIAEELDSRGTALSVVVSRHLMTVACTCLAEDFEPVLALLGDIVMNPVFPEAEVATRQAQIVTAIRQDDDNPAVRAVERLMALLYPDGHPYGRPTKGSVESVERATRDRLLELHRTRVSARELIAVIVGDVDGSDAVRAASRVFGSWTSSAPPPIVVPSVAPARGRRRIVVPMMNKAQADIAYGFVAIKRTDPAYYAYWLMNNAFGQYSIGGRLGDSIRERQGMAYYVGSSLDANVSEGPLTIRAGVAAANVDRAVGSIDEEIARLVADGLSEKELEDSRRFLVMSMPRALETNAGIASFLQNAEFFGLGLDYDLRLPSLLGGVTLDQANEAARRTLDPDRASLVIAGPYHEAA